ncbi:DUF2844 domain-containing protein [Andreprevotia chitinilytica]|uniref:DUF2844 domain-containing protein n=1 Tax=Andreprevotia chitinilytica TaxID=396808 RepID=UPI000555E404|nr:DUF2844 domain-containing protein [Andreprevotia chitinilytica]
MKQSLGLALLLCASCLPCWATLGQQASPVQGSARVLSSAGSTATGSAAPYSVQETQTSSGQIIREYLSSTGVVFAVTWQGPTRPDMQQLLGSYFPSFANANQLPHRRGPVRLQQSGLVLQSGGHMGALSGRAYVPQLVPQGVDPETLR